ncbi:MAG: nitrite reductase/ring-hydroxylating ferredoxin subunit [Natrialbaceae archaeon]|jgi:nitrite reductase/ring-hydroxylating ferredoxin subunit
MSDGSERIVALDRVPEDSTFLITVQETAHQTNVDEEGDHREAILLRNDGDVVGWLNYCQHYTHIRLDKGSGATRRNGEVLCTNHGAMFDVESGLCTHGPCEGAFLERIDVCAEDGVVSLTDERFEFVETGGFEGDEFDRTSTSNVEF